MLSMDKNKTNMRFERSKIERITDTYIDCVYEHQTNGNFSLNWFGRHSHRVKVCWQHKMMKGINSPLMLSHDVRIERWFGQDVNSLAIDLLRSVL